MQRSRGDASYGLTHALKSVRAALVVHDACTTGFAVVVFGQRSCTVKAISLIALILPNYSSAGWQSAAWE
jgi:predicted alpha/beta-fold hydrolase